MRSVNIVHGTIGYFFVPYFTERTELLINSLINL